MIPIKSPKKLIEVALPLDDINEESALRKRKAPAGYPTTLHKWWAQRPPAAARAVLFAQMVNDPGWPVHSQGPKGRDSRCSRICIQIAFRQLLAF
ncbi:MULTISPECIES: DUF1156 domain-containing protein [Rhodanobacter]|uniref:DUF1156 domain-containing protein n=1 Tax=Rhodanobacter TaxID=75309 RepID=UPI000400106D|nr:MULTISPECIES: DUF1156 domain-containing protein [Rhodanobacter]UJJ50983.1 DUF1156 domain-containing protein [Rhodanobacter denitrificans]UJM93696.1 DUF1156 domain-containing protein [Rhodanobacter denitrificans]UJM97227.1 DUF1156 domain-containing protein [Rhodanobacter denitrificans]UJN19945.1 DUF1156 domain-containing protein [Rhodanobacter denitrificans]